MSDSDTGRAMAEDLIEAIWDFQTCWPVGSEVVSPGVDVVPAHVLDREAWKEAAALRAAVAWSDRDVWNDARDNVLQMLLAQIKVTLGTGADRREAIEGFRREMEAEALRVMKILVAEQPQGPSPIS